MLWVLFTQTIRAIFIAMNPICYSAYTFWDCVERRHVIALFLCCDDATQPAKVTVLSPKSNSLRLSNESKRCAVFAVFPVTVNVDQYVRTKKQQFTDSIAHTHQNPRVSECIRRFYAAKRWMDDGDIQQNKTKKKHSHRRRRRVALKSLTAVALR